MTDITFPTPEAKAAFEQARVLIAKAKAEGSTELDFGDGGHLLPHLTHLPEELSELTSLRTLNLDNTAITDDAAHHIAKLSNLTGLDLNFTAITDDVAHHIAKLRNLTWLHLESTAITDGAAHHIAKLRNLTHLDLDETKITMHGLQTLSRSNGFLQNPDGDYGFLYTDNTPAAEDPALKSALAGFDGTASDRTKLILDTARDWVPSVGKYRDLTPR